MEIIDNNEPSVPSEIDSFTIIMSVIIMIVISCIISILSIIFTQNVLIILAVFICSLIIQYIIGWITHSVISSRNDKFYSKKLAGIAQDAFNKGLELGQTVELPCPCMKLNRDIITIGPDETKKYNCSECGKDILATSVITTSLETEVFNKDRELEILKQIQNDELRTGDYRSTTQ